MGAQLKIKEVEGFHRRQSHDLAKLLRGMNKEAEAALEKLVMLFESKEEKVRLEALKVFFQNYRDVAKDINQDQFTRLLANHKFKGPGKLVGDEDDGMPEVDFETISEC